MGEIFKRCVTLHVLIVAVLNKTFDIVFCFVSEALQQPVSPASCTSGISSPSADPEVDDVIADMTMTAVKECLTPTEVAAVEANTLPTAGTTDPGADESALMPPPGATYLQLRHHLSMSDTFLFI